MVGGAGGGLAVGRADRDAGQGVDLRAEQLFLVAEGRPAEGRGCSDGRTVTSGGTSLRVTVMVSGCTRAPIEKMASVTGLSRLCGDRPSAVQPAPRENRVRLRATEVRLL